MVMALLMIVAGHVAAGIKIDHYTKGDGLLGNYVGDMMVDHRGYLWVGTWEGLSRWDGFEFVNYNRETGPGDVYFTNRISKLLEDARGNIWVQMYDDHLFRLNRQTDKFDEMTRVYSRFADSRMHKPMAASNGDVWAIVRGSGVLRFMNDSATNALSSLFYAMPPGVDVYKVVEDGSGHAWAATTDGARQLTTGDGRRRVMASGTKVYDMVAGDGGESYWGTSDGRVLAYNAGRDRFRSIAVGAEVKCVGVSGNGRRVYAGTTGNGLVEIDPATGRHAVVKGTEGVKVESLKVDSRGRVWLICDRPGVTLYDPKAGVARELHQEVPASNYAPRSGILEAGGRVWVAMRGGGFGFYNDETGQIEALTKSDVAGNRQLSNIVFSFCLTNPDVLWVSTHNRGLDRITLLDGMMWHYKPVEHPKTLGDNEVKAFYVAADSTLWFSTKDGSLYNSLKNGEILARITHDTNGEPLGGVYRIAASAEEPNVLWLGTRGRGLVRLQTEGRGRYKMRRYVHDPNDPNSLPSNEIQSVVIDGDRLWTATYGGGVAVMDLTTALDEKPVFYSSGGALKGYPTTIGQRVRALTVVEPGRVWAGTTEGVMEMRWDAARRDVKTTAYRQRSDDSMSLGGNDVISLYTDTRGQVWVGTLGGGINRYLGNENGVGRFKRYTTRDGLPSDVVQSIGQSGSVIWCATDGNIIVYNRATDDFTTILDRDGIAPASFTENATVTLPDGTVLFGATDGLYAFNRNRRELTGRVDMNLELTGVLVDGKPTSPRLNAEYEYDPRVTGRLELESRHSAVSVKVASLNHSLGNRVRYAYMLEPDDTSWRDITTSREVVLNDMRPGRHTLRVKAWLTDYPEVDEIVSLEIDVPATPLGGWQWATLMLIAGLFIYPFAEAYYRRRRVNAEPVAEERPAAGRSEVIEIEPQPVEVDEDARRRFVEHLMEWMEENYSNPELKIDELAAASGMGRTTFRTRLKETMEMSPVDFIINFRLKKACMLLRSTDRTVSEVAYMTGYVDPHYFTRAFKQRLGTTPTRYRRENRGEGTGEKGEKSGAE